MDPAADDEPELVGELGDEGGDLPAEEAAIHVESDAPGGVDSEVDSYTGEPVRDEDLEG
jgi:hypothetical protein